MFFELGDVDWMDKWLERVTGVSVGSVRLALINACVIGDLFAFPFRMPQMVFLVVAVGGGLVTRLDYDTSA